MKMIKMSGPRWVRAADIIEIIVTGAEGNVQVKVCTPDHLGQNALLYHVAQKYEVADEAAQLLAKELAGWPFEPKAVRRSGSEY